jgi:Tfp pilus assembly protein PilF
MVPQPSGAPARDAFRLDGASAVDCDEMARCLFAVLVVALVACTTPAPVPPVTTALPTPPPAAVPTTPQPSPGQLALDRGHALRTQGDLVAAATALREAVRLDPDLIEARVALGATLWELGDLDGAVDELRAALRRQPDSVSARLALARVYLSRQEWAAARGELDTVVGRQPGRPDAHFALGIVRYAQGEVNPAIDEYRRVLAADPQQPDAHYHLGLLLTLAQRGPEATPEFLAAAQAGHARAQYFVGAAYASGLGVPRDVGVAVGWWFKAADQGVPQAEEALAQWRLAALGRGRRGPAERQAATVAFQDYRASLWKEFPDLARGDTVGGALLDQGRVNEAVVVLIHEASALSEPAQRLLETLYENGVSGALPPRDPRIQVYLQTAAAEGRRAPLR